MPQLRHPHVDERHVGFVLLDLLERLLPVPRARHDLDSGLGDELRDRLEDGRVVVGDHTGDWVFLTVHAIPDPSGSPIWGIP